MAAVGCAQAAATARDRRSKSMDHTISTGRLYDLINAGDIDGFGRQLADDFIEHDGMPGLPPTKESVVQYFRMLLALHGT
jgi:hypothetical protein